MYYVLTKNGVYTGRKLNEFQRSIGKLEENDFHQSGKDKILKLEVGDISFVQDKLSLSRIPINNLYKEDKQSNIMMIAILVFTIFNLLKG